MIDRPYDETVETRRDIAATAEFVVEQTARVLVLHPFLDRHIADQRAAVIAQCSLTRADFTSLRTAYDDLHTGLQSKEGVTSLRYRRTLGRPLSTTFKMPLSLPPNFIDVHEAVKASSSSGQTRGHDTAARVGELIFGQEANPLERLQNTVYYLVEKILNIVDEARLRKEKFKDILEGMANRNQVADPEIGKIIDGARRLVAEGVSIRLYPTQTRIYISAPTNTFQENNNRPLGRLLILGGRK